VSVFYMAKFWDHPVCSNFISCANMTYEGGTDIEFWNIDT